MKQPKKRDRYITRQIHRLFWRSLLEDKRHLIVCYLTRMPASGLSNAVIPLVSALAIQAIITGHTGRIAGYAWLVFGLSAAYAVLWRTGGIAETKNAVVGSKYLQNLAFANFLEKDYDFYSDSFFGSLGAQATRLRDAGNLYGELMTLSIPRQFMIVATGVAIVAWHSLLLAAITLVSMAAVLGYTLASSSWRLQYRRQVGESSSVISGHVADALSHGATVKSFAMEDYEQKRLGKPLGSWAAAQARSWNSASLADSGRVILAGAATGVLLVVSGQLYAQGTISIAIVALIQLYVIRLIASTQEIADMIKRYEDLMGQAYQPVATMLVPTTIKDPEHPVQIKPSGNLGIRCLAVSYHYPEAGEQAAVKNFTLDIKPGVKIGIVGYSGAGKSTLTKLLLRFMDVTEGSIAVGGTDIREVTQHDLRNILSYVPQEPLLFHRSIAENICYSRPNATRSQVERVAKLAYVDEFVRELPSGYDTLVGERGVKLSGGQRQRVAIARALLKDAPILILDEATSALDSRSEKFIQEALWKLMKDRTAVVIAHRLSTIQRLDRIVVMDKGRIVQTGTHDELKSKAGIYADLWDHQSGGYIGRPLTSVLS